MARAMTFNPLVGGAVRASVCGYAERGRCVRSFNPLVGGAVRARVPYGSRPDDRIAAHKRHSIARSMLLKIRHVAE